MFPVETISAKMLDYYVIKHVKANKAMSMTETK